MGTVLVEMMVKMEALYLIMSVFNTLNYTFKML